MVHFSEFAQKIRDKFRAGDGVSPYDDVPDEVLSAKFVQKFPAYHSQVDFGMNYGNRMNAQAKQPQMVLPGGELAPAPAVGVFADPVSPTSQGAFSPMPARLPEPTPVATRPEASVPTPAYKPGAPMANMMAHSKNMNRPTLTIGEQEARAEREQVAQDEAEYREYVQEFRNKWEADKVNRSGRAILDSRLSDGSRAMTRDEFAKARAGFKAAGTPDDVTAIDRFFGQRGVYMPENLRATATRSPTIMQNFGGATEFASRTVMKPVLDMLPGNEDDFSDISHASRVRRNFETQAQVDDLRSAQRKGSALTDGEMQFLDENDPGVVDGTVRAVKEIPGMISDIANKPEVRRQFLEGMATDLPASVAVSGGASMVGDAMKAFSGARRLKNVRKAFEGRITPAVMDGERVVKAAYTAEDAAKKFARWQQMDEGKKAIESMWEAVRKHPSMATEIVKETLGDGLADALVETLHSNARGEQGGVIENLISGMPLDIAPYLAINTGKRAMSRAVNGPDNGLTRPEFDAARGALDLSPTVINESGLPVAPGVGQKAGSTATRPQVEAALSRVDIKDNLKQIAALARNPETAGTRYRLGNEDLVVDMTDDQLAASGYEGRDGQQSVRGYHQPGKRIDYSRGADGALLRQETDQPTAHIALRGDINTVAHETIHGIENRIRKAGYADATGNSADARIVDMVDDWTERAYEWGKRNGAILPGPKELLTQAMTYRLGWSDDFDDSVKRLPVPDELVQAFADRAGNPMLGVKGLQKTGTSMGELPLPEAPPAWKPEPEAKPEAAQNMDDEDLPFSMKPDPNQSDLFSAQQETLDLSGAKRDDGRRSLPGGSNKSPINGGNTHAGQAGLFGENGDLFTLGRDGEPQSKAIAALDEKSTELGLKNESGPVEHEDFGEKIGGARKDKWAERDMRISDLDDMTEREAQKLVTKKAIWKEPDWASVVAELEGSGMERNDALRLAMQKKSLREMAPSPSPAWGKEHMADYISAVELMRDYVESVKDKPIYNWESLLRGVFGEDILRGYNINPAAKNARMFSVFGTNGLKKFFNAIRVAEKLNTAIKKGWPGEGEPWQRKFQVTQATNRRTGVTSWYAKAFSTSDGAPNWSDPFTDRESAIQWAKDWVDNREQQKAARKPDARPKPEGGNGSAGTVQATRDGGKDWRKGKRVTGDDMLNDFGFRGGEFGKWASQAERQASLDFAYDSLMDLADVLGVPPKALSLNGELAIAFGARGGGHALAHYEPGRVVINLTKTKGAGSLAHEWAHAVDDYFARQAGLRSVGGESYVSHGAFPRDHKMRPEMAEAWQRIVNAIQSDENFNDTEYKKISEETGKYWGRKHEMFARAFEQWVGEEMHAKGLQNTYLAKSDYSHEVYPQGKDRERIHKSLGDWAKTIKTKPGENGNVIMFSLASEAGVPDTHKDRANVVEAARKAWAEKGVESPWFKRWFGDSKVVDSDGNPMVVYHGTDAEFNEFDFGKIGSNYNESKGTSNNPEDGGFFFTTRRSSADNFAGDDESKSRIIESYLNFKNPYVETVDDYWDAAHKLDNSLNFKELRRNGFDGAIIKSPNGSLLVAFSPTQIKSATGNRGTFDKGDADIRFSLDNMKPIIIPEESAPPKDATGPERRKWLKKLLENLRTPEKNLETGIEARPNGDFIRKIASHSTDTRHMAPVANLREIFRKATLIGENENFDEVKHPDAKKWLYFVHPVKFGNETGFFRIVVKQNSNGNYLYDAWNFESSENANSTTLNPYPISKRGGSSAALTENVSKSAGEVKPSDSSDLSYSLAKDDPRQKILTHMSKVLRSKGLLKSQNDLSTEWGAIPESAKNDPAKRQAYDQKWKEAEEALRSYVMDNQTTAREAGLNPPIEGHADEFDVQDAIWKFRDWTNASTESKFSPMEREHFHQARVAAQSGSKAAGHDEHGMSRRTLAGLAKTGNRKGGSILFESLGEGFTARSNGAGGWIVKHDKSGESFDVPRDGSVWIDGETPMSVQYNGPEGPVPKEAGQNARAQHFGDNDLAGTEREDSARQVATRSIVDSLDDLANLESRLKNKDASAYRAYDLAHGKTDYNARKAQERFLRPIMVLMKRHGFSQADVDSYLYAKHAKAVNAYVATINKDLPDGGSGMSNADADKILTDLKADAVKWQGYEAIGALNNKLNDWRMDLEVKSGLRSEADAIKLRKEYPDYVPLRGLPNDETGRPGVGKGQTAKQDNKKRMGRKSKAENVLAQNFALTLDAIVNAERNIAARELWKMAGANPDPKYWAMDPAHTKPTLVTNKETGKKEVQQAFDRMARQAPGVVPLFIDGEAHYLEMKTPEGQRFAEAIKGLSSSQSNIALQYLGKANRMLASLITTYSPEFILTNLSRDALTAMIVSYGRDGAKVSANTMKGILPAMTAIWGNEAGVRTGHVKEWADWKERWEAAGGKVGFMQSMDFHELAKDVDTQLQDMGRSKYNPKKMAHTMVDLFDKANSGVESATRLSYFRALVENGMDEKKAAQKSKELTTNFNRRGDQKWLNQVYMFFNAAIQGTNNIYKLLSDEDPAVRKRARHMVGFLFGAGAGITMYNMMAGGEDENSGKAMYEKKAAFEKANQVVLMMPNGSGSAVTIPLPYGFNLFYNMGRLAVEGATRKNGYGGLDMASEMMSNAVAALNPVGVDLSPADMDASIATLATPSIVRPVAELARNKDFSGRPIAPDGKVGQPDSQKFNRGVNPLFKHTAALLNSSTGGDEFHPGGVDVSPESIEHVFNAYTGGLGRFMQQGTGIATTLAEGKDDVRIRQIPFLRRYFSEQRQGIDRGEFRNIMEGAKRDLDQLNSMAKKDDPETDKFVDDHYANVVASVAFGRLKSKETRLRFAEELGEWFGESDLGDEYDVFFAKAWKAKQAMDRLQGRHNESTNDADRKELRKLIEKEAEKAFEGFGE